jgi:arylsulfatase A-like enzyme
MRRASGGAVLRAARMGAALFVTLYVAKLTVCVLRAIDGGTLGLLRVLAVGREEAAVAIAFTAIALALAKWAPRRVGAKVILALYAALVVVATFNVPVTRVFASPLTASMREASHPALAGSIAVHVNAGNVLAIVLVAAIAIGAPRAVASWRRVAAAATTAIVVMIAGAVAPDTLGLHRDPALTLAASELRRIHVFRQRAESASTLAPEDDAVTRGTDLEHLAGAARGRHVVWVILESTGARYLRAYGATDDPTPNLTRLASEGITFENAYAVYPESIKGFYAALCSFAPAPHTTAGDYAAGRLPCRALPETFHGAGYATGLWHSGRFGYFGMDHIVRGRGYDTLADAKTIRGKHASSFGTDDMTTVAAVLARFDALKPGERLFATYMPISGHHPYESPGAREVPRAFGEDTELHRYESDLHLGDQALGALVSGLRARGVWNDTLLVINGDHGEAFLQHEGNFAHTMFVYEENVHVPLVVVAPGIVTGAIRARQPVSLLDLAPTVAALVGTPPDPSWQGRSALDPAPRIVRSLADATSERLALRNGRFKLVLDADTGRAELFDLALDPYEQHDRSATDPRRVAAYRADLLGWTVGQRARIDAPLAKR